ncbi:hypothetical protein Bbelb_100170 [Branchiostoma belcheri]|nr:hypothetical protein Bbelb_100170 [Branchiostoma belcheri]
MRGPLRLTGNSESVAVKKHRTKETEARPPPREGGLGAGAEVDCVSSVQQRAPLARGYSSGDPKAPGTFRGTWSQSNRSRRSARKKYSGAVVQRGTGSPPADALRSRCRGEGLDCPGASRTAIMHQAGEAPPAPKEIGFGRECLRRRELWKPDLLGRSSNRSHTYTRSFDGPLDARHARTACGRTTRLKVKPIHIKTADSHRKLALPLGTVVSETEVLPFGEGRRTSDVRNERKGWGSLASGRAGGRSANRDPPRRPLRPLSRPAGRPGPGKGKQAGVDCARPFLEDLGEWRPVASRRRPRAVLPKEALDRRTPLEVPRLKTAIGSDGDIAADLTEPTGEGVYGEDSVEFSSLDFEKDVTGEDVLAVDSYTDDATDMADNKEQEALRVLQAPTTSDDEKLGIDAVDFAEKSINQDADAEYALALRNLRPNSNGWKVSSLNGPANPIIADHAPRPDNAPNRAPSWVYKRPPIALFRPPPNAPTEAPNDICLRQKDYEIVSPECGELRILRYNSGRHDSTSMIFGRQITAVEAEVKYKFRLHCDRWTGWFDRDNPSGIGDYETLLHLRRENPGKICSTPSAIQARVRGSQVPASQTGEHFDFYDTDIGLACRNSHQSDRYCQDYEVRFCCSQSPNPGTTKAPANPTITTQGPTNAPIEPPNCDQWTGWFNRDNPSGNGDYETLLHLRRENPGKICSTPSAIQARVRGSQVPASQTGEHFDFYDTDIGLACRNSHQSDRYCQDYEVRFCCSQNPNSGTTKAPANPTITTQGPTNAPTEPPNCDRWTGWFDRDHPSGSGDYEALLHLRRENPGKICSTPSAIQARVRGSQVPASQTGEHFYYYNTVDGFACRNADQSDRYCQDYEVRFCCSQSPNPGTTKALASPTITTQGPTNAPIEPPNCDRWTGWFDRDHPSGNGDFETLLHLRRENPGKICSTPSAIQARVRGSQVPASSTGEHFYYYNTVDGFACRNADQSDRYCQDYEVRFCCSQSPNPGTTKAPANPTITTQGPTNAPTEPPNCDRWTGWFDRDNPSGNGDFETLLHLRRENPGKICSTPSAIQARVRGSQVPASQTGEHFDYYDTDVGFACTNYRQSDRYCQDYEVRFCCSQNPNSGTTNAPANPTIATQGPAPTEPPNCDRWASWFDPGKDLSQELNSSRVPLALQFQIKPLRVPNSPHFFPSTSATSQIAKAEVQLQYHNKLLGGPGVSQKIIFLGPRGIDDYARMETTLSEDLNSFTLCVHMRSNMDSSNAISLVSYAVSQHNNELLLYCTGSRFMKSITFVRADVVLWQQKEPKDGCGSVGGNKLIGHKSGTDHEDPKHPMIPVWDGEWHAVCTTWRSSDGAWQLYADGVLTASGSGFKVGGRVRTGGTWILGQHQDVVGGGFNAYQSFIGELSEVNLWDRVLSPAEIAADCSYHGNVIDWDTTNTRVFGDASRAEYQCGRTVTTIAPVNPTITTQGPPTAPKEAPNPCPQNYEHFVVNGAKKCMRFSARGDRKSYQAAGQTCRDEGARLVVIKSAELDTFIDNRIKTTYAAETWIGLDDLTAPASQYRWSDRSVLGSGDFNDWSPGQPDTIYREKCVEIRPQFSYHWNNHHCNLPKNYICEIRWSVTTPAPVKPTIATQGPTTARNGAPKLLPTPPADISASTTCTNEYMELSIPEDQLTDINSNNLHWKPDRNCGATTNGTHYIFRTQLYGCGTQVKFGPRYVEFVNTINILGIHFNTGVITRDSDISITSKCNYERQEWVDSTFLPIPGGLNFTEEGFGQLEVRLSMLRQHVYMQLEVQGHGQKLSVLALNCRPPCHLHPTTTCSINSSGTAINSSSTMVATGTSSCASDPTLKTYDVSDPGKERFGFEAFRFIREVRTVYVHCEVLVCDAADSGSRCAQRIPSSDSFLSVSRLQEFLGQPLLLFPLEFQVSTCLVVLSAGFLTGCVKRGKRAAGHADMRGRHMIYQGPIILDDDKEAADDLHLVNGRQTTGPGPRSGLWTTMAAGGVLMALALLVIGAATILKRSRRDKWAYQGLPSMEEDGE